MKNATRLFLLGLAACAMVCATPSLRAAVPFFSLGAPQNVSGDSDVSTAGTLVNAFNLGSTSVGPVTVNGVTFQPFGFPTFPTNTTNTTSSGNYAFKESIQFLTSDDTMSSGSAPFSGLSSNYQTLLSSGGGATAPLALTLTVGGLISGQQYQFQFWVSRSAIGTGAFGNLAGSVVATSGPSSQTLDPNSGNATGGLGQFVIGTTTAFLPTMGITFNGTAGGSPFINAFQLRAIPEPSSCLLGGLGLLVFLRRSRSIKGRNA